MDELTFPRPDDLTDDEWTALVAEVESYADLRYRETVAARTFAPHVIPNKAIVEDEPGQEAVAAKDRVKRKYDAVTDCPDCTRGLIADGDRLICYDLRRYKVAIGGLTTTSHDIVACGR